MANASNSTPGDAPAGICVTLTPAQRMGILGPLEGHLNELETRLDFLVDFFAHRDATMKPEALHLMLSDAWDNATAAREAWQAAWVGTGGLAS